MPVCVAFSARRRARVRVALLFSCRNNSYSFKTRHVFKPGQARRLIGADETKAKSSDTTTGRAHIACNPNLGGSVSQDRDDANGFWTLNASIILGGPERQPDGTVKMVLPALLPLQARASPMID